MKISSQLSGATIGLLDLADHLLRDWLVDYPTEAVDVIRSCIKGEAGTVIR